MSSPTAAPELSRNETYTLAGIVGLCGSLLYHTFERGEGEPLLASIAFSGLAFCAAYAMIRWLGPTFVRAGLSGLDKSKVNNKELLPECMGAVCAVVYLFSIMVFILIPFYKDIVVATSGGGNKDVVMNVDYVQEGRLLHRFPHGKVRTRGLSIPAFSPVYH